MKKKKKLNLQLKSFRKKSIQFEVSLNCTEILYQLSSDFQIKTTQFSYLRLFDRILSK